MHETYGSVDMAVLDICMWLITRLCLCESVSGHVHYSSRMFSHMLSVCVRER